MFHFPEDVVAKGAVSRKDITEKGTTVQAHNVDIMHQFTAYSWVSLPRTAIWSQLVVFNQPSLAGNNKHT